ncbi:hypothetical protein SAICODRAFT_207734 [Saitoella complicata NRRL Y-17804]|uniref:Zn(2)-C6 fungal-type domain-containing protein n=1 Tax=Saitoella complicata (strain BCRC 22490 / CBS 7301 / JCM 7358 / NBRC 10748 / NRRL Y-17804) TaxID=698492 RepID=A0A0E9NM80_SAICN|nr:uncharacterized protein SAICODRAFT_207734 [Saitoella complicata NRRL Y-17804]ODQ54867.1 hypothetical protein SAICODRAFT_207734 [Saitoella complicata NRRL Y-17804]GAO50525.1 hypothetical protein G7K_4649-t1 [Saitoella complicata NRRL Y-17804]
MEKRFNIVAGRRSHRKSRLGCINCKRRHIKCDETKPECANCYNHMITCDYTVTASASVESPATAVGLPRTGSDNSQPGRRIILYPFQRSTIPYARVQTCPSCTSAPAEVLGIPGFSFSDLQLQHHFITSTALTFSGKDGRSRFWKIDVPKMGHNSPFLLHLILALSALHLAHLHPDRCKSYTAQADHRHTSGLQSVMLSLSNLTADNCDAVWVSSVLLCFISFARGPRPGDYLFFGEAEHVSWLTLLRGVRSVIEFKEDQFHSGLLAPIVQGEALTPKEPEEMNSLPYREKMELLREFVISRATHDPSLSVYLSAVDSLTESFTAICDGIAGTDNNNRFAHILFKWTYSLPPEFSQALEERQVAPLVVLAHFLVLMKHELGEVWIFAGWAEHILSEVYECLCEEDRASIEWPIEEVG